MKRNYDFSNTKEAPKRKPRGHKVDIPFSDDEKQEFLSFIESTGKSQGPWVRIVIRSAMAAEKKALQGVTHV